MSTTAANRYLEGNYAPVADEVTAFDLPVIGELPRELDGRYLRNGPNPIVPPDPATHHWFLGDGMVHGVRVRDGRVEWYRNRYVGSDNVGKHLGRPALGGPNWNASPGGPNTNVGGFAGKLWATVEAGGTPVELDGNLDSVARNAFEDTLPNGFSAHPKYDASTGELHAMCYAWPHLGHLQYVIVGPEGRVRSVTEIPVPGMPMVHDMSITGRYALVYDLPVTVDIDLAFAGSSFPFRWNPDYGSRVGLLPRGAGASADDIVWCDAPLGYAYHPLNAYDTERGTVVVDLPVFEKMFDRDGNGPIGDGAPRLERWEIDPATRSTARTVVDERPVEFPRHNPSVGSAVHRYGYFAGAFGDDSRWPTVKFDYATGIRTEHDHGAGRAAGEAVFVAREGGTAEDDGWLLTYVHDAGDASTEFVVLEAQDLSRPPVARVPLPQRVPFGFHGNWVPEPTTR